MSSDSPERSECDRSVGSAGTAATRQQRQQRDEILMLKKSMPTRTELLRIMDSHPQEGERLVRFCRGIQAKIRELELEYAETVREAEQRRRDEKRERAQERYHEHKHKVVERFMDKTLSAEDRQRELTEARRQKVEEKLALEYVRQQEAEEERRQAEEARLRSLDEKKHSWHRAVAAVAQRRVEQKHETDQKLHQEGLQYQERQAKERREKAEEQARLANWANRIEHDATVHRSRHMERLRERQRTAARLGETSVMHPEVVEQRQQYYVAKVQEDNQRIARSEELVERRKHELTMRAKQDREQRQMGAHARLEKRRQEDMARAMAAEQALTDRLRLHSQRMDEKRQEVTERAREKAAKTDRCKSAVDNRDDERYSNLSQKIIDRTIRIASSLGVDLPPILPPSTLQTVAAAPLPERHVKETRRASEDLTFKPIIHRKRYKIQSPYRSRTAPPGAGPNGDIEPSPVGVSDHPLWTSLLLVMEPLAPPKSLLRVAASIMADRLSNQDNSLGGRGH
jgi:hypothetical protein